MRGAVLGPRVTRAPPVGPHLGSLVCASGPNGAHSSASSSSVAEYGTFLKCSTWSEGGVRASEHRAQRSAQSAGLPTPEQAGTADQAPDADIRSAPR